jgi:hypothetical protein
LKQQLDYARPPTPSKLFQSDRLDRAGVRGARRRLPLCGIVQIKPKPGKGKGK